MFRLPLVFFLALQSAVLAAQPVLFSNPSFAHPLLPEESWKCFGIPSWNERHTWGIQSQSILRDSWYSHRAGYAHSWQERSGFQIEIQASGESDWALYRPSISYIHRIGKGQAIGLNYSTIFSSVGGSMGSMSIMASHISETWSVAARWNQAVPLEEGNHSQWSPAGLQAQINLAPSEGKMISLATEYDDLRLWTLAMGYSIDQGNYAFGVHIGAPWKASVNFTFHWIKTHFSFSFAWYSNQGFRPSIGLSRA